MGLAVLYVLDMQVFGIDLYAFAVYLRSFECGIPTALDDGLAACVANMAVAVRDAVAIAAAFANIAAGKTQTEAVAEIEGYTLRSRERGTSTHPTNQTTPA